MLSGKCARVKLSSCSTGRSPPPCSAADVRLVYVDEHLVVVQKPAGVTTLRHREETDLPIRRKQLQPTLDELVERSLAEHLGLSDGRSTTKEPTRLRAAETSQLAGPIRGCEFARFIGSTAIPAA